MAASPGSLAGSEGSRPSSCLASIEDVADERDFDSFEDIIPDSVPQRYAISDSMIPNPVVQDAGIEDSFIPDSVVSNAQSANLPLSKEPTLDMEDLAADYFWTDRKPPPNQACEPAPPALDPPPRSSVPSSKFLQSLMTNPKTNTGLFRNSNRSLAMDLPELGLGRSAPSGEPPSSNSQGKSKSPERSLGSQSRATSKRISPSQSINGSPSPSVLGRCERGGRPKVLQASQNAIVLAQDHEGAVQGDATTQQKNTRPTPLQKQSTQHLSDYKLPLSRAGRRGTPQCPSSIGGDLDGPVVQTSKHSRRSTAETRARPPSRPIPSPRQQEILDRHHSRSLSRASNISRKRSSGRRQRTRTDPDRRREAMTQVKNSWNECLQVSLDESAAAEEEIKHLQDELAGQGEKLVKAIELAKEKELLAERAQSRCAKLKDDNEQATGENERLNDEVEALKQQLCETEKRASEINTTAKNCQAKLNEVFLEQNELRIRTSNQHQEAQRELQAEKAGRAANASTMEERIEASQKKYEELMSEVRANEDRESLQRNEIISQLKATLQQRETELDQSQEDLEELRHCYDELVESNKASEIVQTQVEALLDKATKREVEDGNQREFNYSVSSRLDRIIEHLNASSNGGISLSTIRKMMKTVENNIVAGILPQVLQAVSTQRDAEESITPWKDDICSKLEHIQRDLQKQDQKQSRNREDNEANQSSLRDVLSRLENQSNSMEKSNEQTMHDMRTWSHRQDSWQRGLEQALRAEGARQIKNRESAMSSFEEKLRKMAENNGKGLELMRELILQGGEGAKKHVQDAAEAIHNRLLNEFNQTRECSERALSWSLSTQATLESLLEEVKNKLIAALNEDNQVTELQEVLGKEQANAAELRKRISQLEHESKAAQGLREKWVKDIKRIDVLKAQVKDFTSRLPHLESVEEIFQKILRSNQTINCTAEYLVAERTWVDQQLKDKPGSAVQGSNVDKTVTPLPIDNLRENAVSEPPIMGKISRPLKPSAGSFSQDEATRRVIIESRGNTPSPLPPPSIQQEQLRRREAISSRSILKAPHSSQNSAHEQKPAAGKAISVLSGGNQDAIDQVRSTFISDEPKGFPSIVEFERSEKISRQETVARERKHGMALPERGVKRVKQMKGHLMQSQR